MKLLSTLIRWLTVFIILFFGLLIVCLAYFVRMGKILSGHKSQAALPELPTMPPASTVVVGQPDMNFHRVRFDDTHHQWLDK